MVICIPTTYLLVISIVVIVGGFLFRNINRKSFIANIYSIRCTYNYVANGKIIATSSKEYSYVSREINKEVNHILAHEGGKLAEELVHSYKISSYTLEEDMSQKHNVDLYLYNDKVSLDIKCELLEKVTIDKNQDYYDYVLQYKKYL